MQVIKEWVLDLLSFKGVLGRDDYLKSYLYRQVIWFFGMSIYLIPVLLEMILKFIVNEYTNEYSYEEMDGLAIVAVNKWFTDHAIATYIYFTFLDLLLFLPIYYRRLRDLGSKLKKRWMYVLVVYLLMPRYILISLPVFNALRRVIFILALYPRIKLFFVPGKKHATMQEQ